jgi:serine/threonine protein kinase
MSRVVPGDRLGKYRLERLLGRGGMGEVWAARDPDLDRVIALKVLRPALAESGDARARLQREGRAMARLRHANVITVHDAVFTEGRGLIAMELIDGENMAAWLTRRPSTPEIVRVLLAAGRGLAAAHAGGMIHRDFKPHNVLIDGGGGRVVVTDFGLARAEQRDPDPELSRSTLRDSAPPSGMPDPSGALDATAAPVALDATATPAELDATAASPAPATRSTNDDLSTSLTRTGSLLGTPAYMAPEQLAGGDADARSDQFAFCVTAWEAFAGVHPFHATTFPELLAAVERNQPGAAEHVPGRLRPILMRGLARDPADRWPSIDALLAAIERAWRRPRRIAAAAAVAAAVVVVGGAVAFAATRDPGTAALDGCRAPADELAVAWSPAVRAALVGRLGAGPDTDRVVARIDRWTASWSAVQTKTCAARDAPDFAVRRACLTAIRDELARVTTTTATGPLATATPEPPDDDAAARPSGRGVVMPPYSSPELFRAVAAAEECDLDPGGVPPPPADPALRAQVAAVRWQLSTTRSALVSGTMLAALADATAPLARAEALGDAALLIDARALDVRIRMVHAGVTTALPPLCVEAGAIATAADAAGYARGEVDALMIQHECARIAGEDGVAAAVIDRLAAALPRIGNPLVRAEVQARLAMPAIRDGRFAAAAVLLDDARAAFAAVGADVYAADADLLAVQLRVWRGSAEDLAAGAGIVARWRGHQLNRWAWDVVHELAWRRGDLAAVPPRPVDAPSTPTTGRIDVAIEVVGADGPVAGAQVAASRRAIVDATRAAMTSVGVPVTGETDAGGKLALSVLTRSVVVARAGDQIGAIAVDGPGAYRIRLVPGARIRGVVDQVDAIELDPIDALGRARRRAKPVVILSTFIGERVLAFAAPVAADGTWSLPAVLPGAYTFTAQAEVALGGVYGMQRPLDVAPGDHEAPRVAFDAAPRVIELVVRPLDGGAVAFPGDAPVPATWDELGARLATAPEVSVGQLASARVEDSVFPDDKIARMAISTRGAVTVCALAGIQFDLFRPISRLGKGGTTPLPAPRCALAPTGEGVIRVKIR